MPDRSRAAQDDAADGFGRSLPLRVRQGAVVQRFDLMGEIGVMLGGGPDHVEQPVRIDRAHLPGLDPAADHGGARFGPVAQGGFQIILDDWRAVDHLVRPDL